MSDRVAYHFVNTFLALNSCAWPWIFGGVALWHGDFDRLWFWVGVSVLTGGGIFVGAAALAWLFRPAQETATASQFWRHVPPASKFVGAAVIMFLLGGAGVLATTLWPQPPIYRFGRP